MKLLKNNVEVRIATYFASVESKACQHPSRIVTGSLHRIDILGWSEPIVVVAHKNGVHGWRVSDLKTGAALLRFDSIAKTRKVALQMAQERLKQYSFESFKYLQSAFVSMHGTKNEDLCLRFV
jgi:hypothetical protein